MNRFSIRHPPLTTAYAGSSAQSRERRIAQGTCRRRVFVLRSFYDWTGRRGDDNPARRVRPPSEPQIRGAVYTERQADQLLDHIKSQATADGKHGLRAQLAYAIVSTLHSTGLRNAELRNLRFDDLDLDSGRIRVLGKGNKERHVPVPPSLATVPRDYLANVRPKLPKSDYVFANPRSLSGTWHGRIADKALGLLISDLSEGCPVPGPHRPHRWRHTYATKLVRAGKDVQTVQRLLGHASPHTTFRYLHMDDDDLKAAVTDVFG